MRLTRFAVLSTVAFLLAMGPGVAEAGDAAKAKRSLMSAKSNAESRRWDELDGNMKKAAADMEGLSDAEKAPLLATIAEIKALVTKDVEEDVTKRLDRVAKAEPGQGKLDTQRAMMRLDSAETKGYADPAVVEKLRARLATVTGAPAPTTPAPNTPAPTTPGVATPGKPMTGDLATAAARLRTAKSMLDGGDPRFADELIRQAMRLLEPISEADKAALMADAAALTQKIDAFDIKARRDEETRRINEQVGRFVRTAESSIQDGLVSDSEWIDKSERLLAGHDAKTFLDAKAISAYQARLDETRAKLKAHNKRVSIERSADILKELEAKVAADPFKGADEREVYNVFNSLNTLANRVRGEFDRVPHDEPEINAVLDRVTAAMAKIESASGKWAAERMEADFAGSWKFRSDSFAGWEPEKLAPDAIKQRRIEGLSKTSQAVSGSVYWLNDAETKKTLEKQKENATVKATAAAARKTLDDASAKLNEAFNAILDDAEKQPMPNRESDRAQITYLVGTASDLFAGTKYKEPNVARAKALDEKWKAEVARLEKEMEETLKKLTAEANARWPAIEIAMNPDKTFDPADAERWKGKTIIIKGYYNRARWDFDAAYDFAATIKGVPVSGNYAPHVVAAFNEGSSKTKFGIDDHVGWDVVGIVEGPGKINRRVTTEWKDANTRRVIMKTESYVAEPCVVIKIIGLRAGPVAVGAK